MVHSHDVALETGGVQGILNEEALYSAIERPHSGYYESIYEKAAALVESLICNHGFVDGNKRTAVILLGILITRSGYSMNTSSTAVTEYMVGVASGAISFEHLVSWFREILIEKRDRSAD